VPRGEPVRLFYEIYGASAPFRISYQLEGQEDDGRWSRLGNPQEREGTTKGQGFELPTGTSWPATRYRVHVTVVDAAGARSESTASFSVGEAPPTAAAPAPVVREP
jgi:hypothetical protein